MFYIRYIFLFAIVVFFDSTIGTRFSYNLIRPDFSLALVVYAGLSGGGARGCLIGFLVGLLRGCGEPQLMGLESLLMALVGFGSAGTSPMVNRSHPFVQAILIAIMLLAHDLIRILVVMPDSFLHSLWYWICCSPAAALYTALVVPAAVALLPRLFGQEGRRALS